MTVFKAPCALEYLPGAQGNVEVRVSAIASRLLGKRCQFYVEAEADVLGPDQPIHARRVIFSTEFEIRETMQPIIVPVHALKMCLYQGSLVRILLYGTLAIDDDPILEKPIDLASLRVETLKPAYGEGTFEFSQEYTIGEMYKSATEALSRYARISLAPISVAAREQRKLNVRDLFKGEASIDLEGCRLQLVAWNTEYAQQYHFNKLHQTEIVDIGKPVRWKIFFEKDLPTIPKGEAIQDYVDDILHFPQMFSAHCPPLKITDFHGIGFRMEARLIHPERHTTLSESLGRDIPGDGVKDFVFEDFFEPV
ncbi:MAG: hypothetical protein ACJA2X_000958 [Halocynthiibacter sp.]|jgi:hypothetical protein